MGRPQPKFSDCGEAAGFDDDEIHSALDWIESLSTLSNGVFDGADEASGMRIYNEAELKQLPTEVRGLLLANSLNVVQSLWVAEFGPCPLIWAM